MLLFHKKNIKKTLRLVIINGLLIPIVSIAANTYQQLEQQLANKHYPQAWHSAEQLLSEHGGDARFDYLYALAAIATHHYDQALFSLDRVVINNPNVIRPRLELARVYLQLNNKRAAIKEFREVLKLDPAPKIKETVEAYLTQLTHQNKRQTKTSETHASLSVSSGYDDNLNFGLDDTAIHLPLLGHITLSSGSIRKKDHFYELSSQARYQKKIKKKMAWFASYKGAHRHYQKVSDFDLLYGHFNVGIRLGDQTRSSLLSLAYQPLNQGGNHLTDSMVLTLNHQYSLKTNQDLSAGLNLERLNHKKDKRQDKTRLILSGKYTVSATRNRKFSQQYQLYLGTEISNKKAGKAFNRQIMGAGLQLSKRWNKQQTSFSGVSLSHYQYATKHPIYNKKRKDNKLTLTIGHQLHLTKVLRLKLSTHHAITKSNLGLYNTKRNQIKLAISYHF